MHSRILIPPAVGRLAQVQAGVVSNAQTRDAGLSKTVVQRLIDTGQWLRLDRGLLLVGRTEPVWLTWVWAGLLLGGPLARAGGMTAARLNGLTEDEPEPAEILIPFGARLADRDWVTFRQERPGIRSISRSEPPCTRIEDTVLDLCGAGTTASAIDWITTAVQRRLTTPEQLTRALQRRQRIPHRKLITGIIRDAADGVQSSLEYHYRHDVELAHGLPTGIRQRSRTARNEFIDVFYEEYALVVELDGRIGHVGRLRDRRRDNVHTRTGSPSLRYGWTETTQESCAVAMEVAEVLSIQGWPGYPTRCPRCLG